jgi:hypothetical protein
MLRRLFGSGSNRQPEPRLPPHEAIERALRRLEGDPDGFEIFSIAPSDRNHYVQVIQARPGGELLGEAVGNGYLKGSARLDAVALQTLADLGWTVVDEKHGNHTRSWADWTGDDRARVVDDIMATLVLAFEMAPDGPLEISDNT